MNQAGFRSKSQSKSNSKTRSESKSMSLSKEKEQEQETKPPDDQNTLTSFYLNYDSEESAGWIARPAKPWQPLARLGRA